MTEQNDTTDESSSAEAILIALKEELDPDVLARLQELVEFLPPEARYISDPRREMMRIIGDKWSTFILLILSAGKFRHASLRRTIEVVGRAGGISQPVLTQKLRNLERNGLVSRHATDDVPPQVEYALTPIGAEFTNQCKQLIDWMGALVGPVEDARTRFDATEQEQ